MPGRMPSAFEHALRAAVIAAALAASGLAAAQDAQPGTGPKSGTAQRAQAAQGGDQDLRKRVEQLEEQLVDMQVVIGTLESLARSGASAAPQSSASVGAFSSGDSARLDGMETQIRALTAQVEQLAADVRASGQRRSDAGPPAAYQPPQGASSYPPPGGSSYPPPQSTATAPPDPSADRFGSTTVTSDTGDAIGGLIDNGPGSVGAAPGPRPEQTSLPPVGGPDAMAAVAPDDAAGGDPKQLYERAYGFLLQQDYTSAQSGFSDFLKRYPKDSLAPNALYWLGETHYVQRNFADAAEAFDLVVATYGTSSKAPEAQLKRGMALAQLGKRQDACTALRQVAAKYPSAPALVKSKAESERARVGCP